MGLERTIVCSLLVLQLVLWLGFLVHRSPRFPGSLGGGLLAVSGALLMVLPPLLYSGIKRIDIFKGFIIRRFSLGTLLTWHVYSAVTGSILAILHTGHRFESNLGILLTAMMMLTVFSGFIGRYFYRYQTLELREKQDLLNRLAFEYNKAAAGSPGPEGAPESGYSPLGAVGRALNSFLGSDKLLVEAENTRSLQAVRLAESIADLEYAIRFHEILKRRTALWLKAHIATSIAFYLLLFLHVASAVYFGLRWFK